MRDEDKSKKELIAELEMIRKELETSKLAFNPYVTGHEQQKTQPGLSPEHLAGRSEESRRYTEISLHENLAFYEAILNTSPDSIAITDLAGRILFASPNSLKMLGLKDTDECINQNILKFLFPEDLPRAQQNMVKMFDEPQGAIEYRILRSDGSFFFAEVNGDIICGDDGLPRSILFIVRDINKRKIAEEKVRNLSLAVEQSPVSILITSPEGEIEYANPKTYETTGYTPEEIFGKNYGVLKLEEKSANKCHIFWNSITEARGSKGISLSKKKNGDIYWESSELSPIIGDNGELISYLSVIEYFTELKNAELEIKHNNDKLKKVNAEKDKLLSIIAHDLRSPLTGFIGLTEFMTDSTHKLSDDRRKEFLMAINRSAKNILTLFENLLQWSNVQRDHVGFYPQLLSLNDLLSECIEAFIETARVKSIGLKLDVRREQKVFADQNMFKTIVRNLISNAIKFTKPEGRVSVSAALNVDNSSVISIADSGIGMSNQILNALFRIDLNIKRRGTGGEQSTGLGLLLCKEFIEKHKGKIEVESEEGKGSTFRFTLPFLV